MLHVGLDLSRKRIDVCLISDQGELIDRLAATPDRDGLYGLARRVAVYGEPVRGVVESMNGARFVHDELAGHGWEVLVADAQKVKGLAPLACKTDKIDSRVLAELSFRDLVPAIWLPTLELRREREISRWRLHLVKHRSTLKNRVHSTLITFGHQRHMSDLFGVAGRRLLGELEIPEPWRSHVDASLVLIDDLEGRITQIAKELRRSGADHRYIPILHVGTRVRVDHLVHGRVRDRRHHPLLLAGQAHRLHRPVPAGQTVRPDGPARPALKARPQVSALGADGGRDRRLLTPALPRALPAHPTPPRQTARPQGRPDRPRPPAHRGDLVHADS